MKKIVLAVGVVASAFVLASCASNKAETTMDTTQVSAPAHTDYKGEVTPAHKKKHHAKHKRHHKAKAAAAETAPATAEAPATTETAPQTEQTSAQ